MQSSHLIFEEHLFYLFVPRKGEDESPGGGKHQHPVCGHTADVIRKAVAWAAHDITQVSHRAGRSRKQFNLKDLNVLTDSNDPQPVHLKVQ